MGYSKSGKLSSFAEMERNEMKVEFNGKIMTVAQYKAKKSALRRKEKSEQKRKKQEYTRASVLPAIRKDIEATRKSTRCLKTIVAFVDNGPIQWPGDYKRMVKFYPEIQRVFVKYHSQYNRILKLEEEMDLMLKKSKTNKNFFQIAQEFGYKMMDLLDIVSELASTVSKSQICDMPLFKGREIVEGAKDGKRKGLRDIMSSTYGNISKTKENLISLSKSLSEAYDEVVQYDENGRQI